MYFKVKAKPATNSDNRRARAVRSREAMTISLEKLRNPAAELQYGGCEHDPAQRCGQKHLPPEPHQLVVAVTGQRALGPTEDEEEERDLEREPDDTRQPSEGRIRHRRHPAAQEQHGAHR